MPEFQPTSQDTNGVTLLHRSLAQLQQSFEALTSPPGDSGRLTLIVCRLSPGLHEPLDRVRLTPEYGVPGDEWNRRTPRNPDAQLTVMRRDVAEMHDGKLRIGVARQIGRAHV